MPDCNPKTCVRCDTDPQTNSRLKFWERFLERFPDSGCATAPQTSWSRKVLHRLVDLRPVFSLPPTSKLYAAMSDSDLWMVIRFWYDLGRCYGRAHICYRYDVVRGNSERLRGTMRVYHYEAASIIEMAATARGLDSTKFTRGDIVYRKYLETLSRYVSFQPSLVDSWRTPSIFLSILPPGKRPSDNECHDVREAEALCHQLEAKLCLQETERATDVQGQPQSPAADDKDRKDLLRREPDDESEPVEQEGGGAADEITLTEAALRYGGPTLSGWTKAAQKPRFPSRKVGRNRLVKAADAKRFADDFDARCEQRMVGSKSNEPDGVLLSSLKKLQKSGEEHRRRNRS